MSNAIYKRKYAYLTDGA